MSLLRICNKCYEREEQNIRALVGTFSTKHLEAKLECVNKEWAIRKQKYLKKKNLAIKESKEKAVVGR